MPAIVETVNLKKRYAVVEAVRGINLRVRENSICAFLGQNGAGKSTTLRMLMGMIRPTSGTGSVFILWVAVTSPRSEDEIVKCFDSPNVSGAFLDRTFWSTSHTLVWPDSDQNHPAEPCAWGRKK